LFPPTQLIAAQKPGFIPEATGHDRTSLVVYIDIDHAGALLEILSVFAKYEVNLTFIQSRPTGRELGHYHFIIDVEGHINDKAVAASMDDLREICDDIRFLGSYPREAR
jgi:prephenate dehydratase